MTAALLAAVFVVQVLNLIVVLLVGTAILRRVRE